MTNTPGDGVLSGIRSGIATLGRGVRSRSRFGSRAGHFQYIDTWRRVVLEYRAPIPLIRNYLHTSQWATCDLDPVSRCYRQSSGRGLNNSPRTAAPDFEAETTHGKIKVG